METLYFTKQFESGLLKGLAVRCHVSYPPESRDSYIKAFRKGMRGSDCITRNKWVITDASFQNYSR